jgi:hypothetical protein
MINQNTYLHSLGSKNNTDPIPEKLLEVIPSGDSFDEYISICRTAIRVGSKYVKFKKWLTKKVLPITDRIFSYEEQTLDITIEKSPHNPINPIAPSAESVSPDVKTPKKYTFLSERIKEKEETLISAYKKLLNTLAEYSKYGLLIHRAAIEDESSWIALRSWTLVDQSRLLGLFTLEKLHNSVIAKIATLPPSIIHSLPKMSENISNTLGETTQHLRKLLEKYIEETKCDSATDEEKSLEKGLKSKIEKLYAGGTYTLNEALQIPAHKVKEINFQNNDWDIMSQINDFIPRHRDEIESIFKNIVACND